MKFKVLVAFTVEAEPIPPWDSWSCAKDFIRHRIDEGYRLEDRILDWEFVSVEPEEKEKSC